MLIRTHKERGDYFMMHKQPINNQELSWKAKGMLAYLMSKPTNWEIRTADLIKKATDGEDAVRAGLNELETAGYIVRKRENDAQGHIQWVCIVYETPAPEAERTHPKERRKTKVQSPYTENPTMDYPNMENPYPTNNNPTNNNENNNNPENIYAKKK